MGNLRLAPLPMALAAVLCGLLAGWACSWILIFGLILVWVSGQFRTGLFLGLLLAAGWLAGDNERQSSAFLRDPPEGMVFLSGEVSRVDEESVGLKLRTGRKKLVMLRMPVGWPAAHLRPGDALHIVAFWEPVGTPPNPGSPDFLHRLRAEGYRGHAARVMAVLREKTGTPAPGSQLRTTVLDRIRSRVNRLFSARAYPWVRAMLLGERSSLPQGDVESFRRSGLAHLLAVSGLHVGVLFGTISLLTWGLISRWSAPLRMKNGMLLFVLALAGVGYGSLLGWPASAARALLMLLLAIMSRWIGRPGWLSRTWMMTLFAALLWVPERMIHDLGAQLSFSAVGGLVVAPGLLRGPLHTWPRPLANGLAAGTAAFLATAPWLMNTIGWIPLGSVLTGLIGIPLGSLFLMTAFSALVMPLGGNVMAALAETILGALLWWARWTGASWHPVLRADTTGWMVVLLIAACVIWVVWPSFSRLIRVSGLLCTMLAWTIRPFPDILTLTILDVGQGESMVVEWQDGGTSVLDTGPGPSAGIIAARYLAFRGKRTVQLMLTHGDRDHVAGSERLAERISVSGLLAPWKDPSDPESLTLQGKRWSPVALGRIFVLHPEEAGRDNTHSMVLLVAMPGIRMLLTGDIDAASESLIAARWKGLWSKGSRRVLKLAHHGSATSTGKEVLEAFEPGVALYSAGQDNAFGHPHAQVLERLASSSIPVFGTSGGGALQVRWNGHQLHLKRWKDGSWQNIDLPSPHPGSAVSVRQIPQSADWR